MLYCFVDTNILLEFQMFNEIDWPKELGYVYVYAV
jgi:hypothetical protein